MLASQMQYYSFVMVKKGVGIHPLADRPLTECEETATTATQRTAAAAILNDDTPIEPVCEVDMGATALHRGCMIGD